MAEKKETRVIEVPQLIRVTVPVTVEGLPPGLLMNRLGFIPPKGTKDTRTTEQKLEEALYLLDPPRDGATYGLPAGAFKAAIVASAIFTSEKQNHLVGALFVLGGPDNLVPLHLSEDWIPTTMKVRPSKQIVVDQHRPFFAAPWTATFEVEFNASSMPEERVFAAVEVAGFNVGIGPFRPQCKGVFGRFQLKR